MVCQRWGCEGGGQVALTVKKETHTQQMNCTTSSISSGCKFLPSGGQTGSSGPAGFIVLENNSLPHTLILHQLLPIYLVKVLIVAFSATCWQPWHCESTCHVCGGGGGGRINRQASPEIWMVHLSWLTPLQFHSRIHNFVYTLSPPLSKHTIGA